jgi:hypothetical protein
LTLGSSGKATLALGFGESDSGCHRCGRGVARAGFDPALDAYRAGWSAYDGTLTNPHTRSCPACRTRSARTSRPPTT